MSITPIFFAAAQSGSYEREDIGSEQGRAQKIQWFKETLGLERINGKKGTINCAHCALRLDDCTREGYDKERGEPVPRTEGRLLTKYIKKTSRKKVAILRSETKDPRMIERSVYPKVTDTTIVRYDLTEDEKDVVLDLTFEEGREVQTKKVRLTRVNTLNDDLAARLKNLPKRASDGACFGLVVLTHKPIAKDGHILNFFVDKDNEVYFIDAQTNTITDKLNLTRFAKDVFFVLSQPKEGFIVKQEAVEREEIEIKEESSSDLETSSKIHELIQIERTCNTCQTTTSKQWYKDPVDNTKDRCRSCYCKAQAERADRTCNSCQTTTSTVWYKDPVDNTKDRCRSCYDKAHAERTDRTCNTCQATTSQHWYKDPVDKTKARCRSCYQKAQAERADRTCNSCQTTTSTHWYKDPVDKTKDRCRSCYRKAQAERADRTCNSCQTTTSTHWFKDSVDKTKDRCRSCYDKARKKQIGV